MSTLFIPKKRNTKNSNEIVNVKVTAFKGQLQVGQTSHQSGYVHDPTPSTHGPVT